MYVVLDTNQAQWTVSHSLVSDIYLDHIKIPKRRISRYWLRIPQRSHSHLNEKLAQYWHPPISPIILNFSGPNEQPVLRTIYRGLLQGSPLRPILFHLYMLLMTQLRLPATMLLFADDVVIYHKYRNLQNATIAVQSWMDKFASTANKLFLHLSTNKCKPVLYTLRPFKLIISTIQFNDQHFEQLTSFKYLGVILDSKLSRKHHIQYLHAWAFTASNILKCLSPSKWGGDPITLLMFYKSSNYVSVLAHSSKICQQSALE